FFSSRRRHTRSTRDWSSDVCSSDLFRPYTSYGERVITNDGFAPPHNVGLRRIALLIYKSKTLEPIVEGRVAAVKTAEVVLFGKRSEERRVGKESRCEWARDD